jgi:hypothetical protein
MKFIVCKYTPKVSCEEKQLKSIKIVAIVLATLMLLGSFAFFAKIQTVSAANPSLLHVEGPYLKDAYGNVITLHGVHWMSWEWEFATNYDQQFAYMQSWGINAVRLTIFRESWSGGNGGTTYMTPFGYVNSATYMNHLDAVIASAQAHGMYVIINGWHSVSSTDVSSTMSQSDWNTWFNWWITLATRYKGQGVIYDLFAEPLYWNDYDHQVKTQQCIDNIRAIDPSAVIMVEASGDGSWNTLNFEFAVNYPINRNNIIYSYHLYGFMCGNGQSDIQYWLNANYVNYMRNNGFCVECGEFGGAESYASFSSFSAVWVQNFMADSDADGYSGYIAQQWTTTQKYGWWLLNDAYGTPSNYGNIIKTYYLSYSQPSYSAPASTQSPTPTPTPTQTPTPTPTGGSATFGLTSIGALTTTFYSGVPRAAQYTPTSSGTVTDIMLYITSGGSGGHAQAAIYADNGGKPGALLAKSSSDTVYVSGWHDFSGFNVAITAGIAYWLAFEADNANLMFYYNNGGANYYQGSAGSYGTFPSPYTTLYYGSYSPSIYAIYRSS